MSLDRATKQPQDFRPRPDEPLRPYRLGGPRTRRRHAPAPVNNSTSIGEPLWDTRYVHQTYCMALLGATDGEIASALGVPYGTFVRWKETKYSLMDALRRAQLATAAVGASLYMRAVGFTHPEEKLLTERTVDEDGSVHVTVKRVTTTVYVPPDVGAAKYWLENKQPERWRSRQEVTGAGGAPLVPQRGDINLAISVMAGGQGSQTDVAKAYLRLVGEPLPEQAQIAAPDPKPSDQG